jgi:hypothetical protein
VTLCSKPFFTIFHNLPIVYHGLSTNLVAFKLCLHFIQLKNFSNTRGLPYFINKMYEISNTFMGTTLKRYQLHEYHFSMNYILLFYALAVQIWFIRRKFYQQKKFFKISKNIDMITWLECRVQNNALMEGKLKWFEKLLFKNSLSCVSTKHMAKVDVCRVPGQDARQTLRLCRAF